MSSRPGQNRLLRWVAGKLRAYMPGPGGIGYVAGSATEYPIYDYEALGKSYAVNPWVNACVKRIAETVADLPLRVMRETGTGDGVEREEVFDGPLVELLWNPGRFTSAYDLIYRTAGSLALNGESWWFIENGSAGQSLAGTPREIRILQPQHIGIKQDKLDLIEGFTYRQSGEGRTFAPEFIVQAKTFNPTDDYRGLPPMQVARAPVLLEYYLTRYNTTFFQNSARPDIMLTSDLPLSEDARKIAAEAWKKAYGGVEKSHGVAVLEGLKPELLGVNAKDGEFLGLDKLTREQVLAIFGVPPVLVGVFEYANYANSAQQIKLYYRYTISPLCALIEQAINTQLIPVWYGADEGLYVEFDLSQAAVVPEDQKLIADTAAVYVARGIKTVNEVRREMNLPDVDWGDDPPAAAPSFGLTSLGETPPAQRKAVVPPTRADQWKAFDRQVMIGEGKIKDAMADFFREQGARVVAAFDDRTVLSGVLHENVRVLRAADLFDVWDDAAEDDAIKRLLMPLIEKIIDRAGSAALGQVGSGISFNMSDPNVAAFLAKKELKVVGLNAVTKEALRQLLLDATADASTVAQTAQDIRAMFDDMAKTRSVTIARTEAVSANNAAALEGFRQSGVVTKKEWLSSKDEAVRESHEAIDGDVIPLEGLFANGLSAPGGDGPPEETVNCRCTVLPVLEDE